MSVVLARYVPRNYVLVESIHPSNGTGHQFVETYWIFSCLASVLP